MLFSFYMNKQYILAIDQGTSGTKTLIVDEQGKVCAKGSVALKTNYLSNGFVEQDPEEIYKNVLASVEECIGLFKNNNGDINSIVTCGISNQRETFVVWDKEGKPLYSAVVWRCKRSIGVCERVRQRRLGVRFKLKTG